MRFGGKKNKKKTTVANIHIFQFGNFEQFKSKPARGASTGENGKKKSKLEGFKQLDDTSDLQANLHASVALHTMSSQVNLGANKNHLRQPGH